MKKIIGLAIALVIIIVLMVIFKDMAKKPEGTPPDGGKPPVSGGPETGHKPPVAKTATDIRIGYPARMLVANHLGETLLRTNVLEKNALRGQVTPLENEQTVINTLTGGAVDVALVSDVSALMMLGKGYKGVIACSLGSLGRTALLVPANSPVKELADLKGKKVAVSFGTSAHRNLLKWLKEKGIKPAELQLLNLAEPMAGLLENKTIDAIVVTDPVLEQYLRAKQPPRAIVDSHHFALALVSNDYYGKNPEAVNKFINVLKETFFFISKNKAQVNEWVKKVSNIEETYIWACSEINMNIANREGINRVRVAVNPDALKEVALFIGENQLTPLTPEIDQIIPKTLVDEAAKEIDPKTYDPKTVQVKP
ncbi:MAG: NrtA/SsuA/CpmA family ABC transporter substrate-binding protein [Planctomycetes bacterium]|nr:NrtA/SsuA/CpmA family ABC transporter substrate-binding protein [Planctomycetota bacterium]